MQLKEFLDLASVQDSSLKKYSVIIFEVKDEEHLSVVFAAQLMRHCKSNGWPVESLDTASLSYAQLSAQLETSFLGMNLIYWLRSIHDIDTKYRQSLLDYCTTYCGPHQIIFFASGYEQTHITKNQLLVHIPQAVNAALFTELFIFFKKKITSPMRTCIEKMCASYSTISLDQACMIIGYLQVMGKYDDETLFERILDSEQSLFALSQSFFAKDAHTFFKLWTRIEAEYPITFWCTYWSEQLWRAYHARYYLDRQQQAQAKSVGYRLPFSYLQKDWKKSTLAELKHAHCSIYELDVAFKNNVETHAGLDLFYSKFMSDNFNK